MASVTKEVPVDESTLVFAYVMACARVLSNTSLVSSACLSVAFHCEKSSLRNKLPVGVHGKKTLAKREALRALARLVRRVGGSESRIAWVFAAHASESAFLSPIPL